MVCMFTLGNFTTLVITHMSELTQKKRSLTGWVDTKVWVWLLEYELLSFQVINTGTTILVDYL